MWMLRIEPRSPQKPAMSLHGQAIPFLFEGESKKFLMYFHFEEMISL